LSRCGSGDDDLRRDLDIDDDDDEMAEGNEVD